MITKQRALFYFVGQQSFKDLAEAQKYDLKQIMLDTNMGLSSTYKWPDGIGEPLAEFMLRNAAEIVDILTTTPTSRLKARKTHGAKPKKVKLKPVVTEAPKESTK